MNYIEEIIKICRERIGYRIEYFNNLIIISKDYGYSIPLIILNKNTNEISFSGYLPIKIDSNNYEYCKKTVLDQRYV